MKHITKILLTLMSILGLVLTFTGYPAEGVTLMAPQAVTGPITEAYLSGFDLNMRKFYRELVQRYGDQGAEFVGMIMALGWESTLDVPVVEHFEDDWIWESFIVNAQAGGAAGASASIVVNSSSINADGEFFPAVKDIIEFPNRDSSGNPIQGYITSITGSTLTVKPLKAAWSIPSTSAGQNLIIITNGNSEASGQPDPKKRGVYLYTNEFAIGKASVEASGSAMTDRTWFSEYGGKQINAYYDIAMSSDLDYRMMQNIQGWILGGVEPDNDINDPDNNKDITWTKGLFPTMNEVSIQHPYTVFGVPDFDEIERGLSKVYAGVTTGFMPGLELDIVTENALKSYLNFTNIDYIRKVNNQAFFGSDVDGEGLSAAIGFSYLQKAKRTFAMKRFSTLHNPQTYGAPGYDYVDRGVMFPLRSKNVVTLRTGKTATVPAIHIVYKALGSYSRKMEVFQTGSADAARWGVTNDVDSRTWHQRSNFALELFSANSFVNIFKANG